MVPDSKPQVSTARGLVFVGLCALLLLAAGGTLLTLGVTLAEGWKEHVQQSWPEASAHVDTCRVKQGTFKARRQLYIQCRLVYSKDLEQREMYVYSASYPPPDVAQYPANQGQPFDDWLNAHPPGTPVTVRYDSADPTKSVMASDFMPRGGSHTADNIKLLAACFVSFIVLLALARLARPEIRPRDAGALPNG
jgi:Protein of unknown function (DUF3592)